MPPYRYNRICTNSQCIVLTVSQGDIAEHLLEDIKVRTCFVAAKDDATKAGTVQYPLPINGSQTLSVALEDSVRAHAFDVLFDGDEDDSVATAILDALLSCSTDARKGRRVPL